MTPFVRNDVNGVGPTRTKQRADAGAVVERRIRTSEARKPVRGHVDGVFEFGA